MITNNKKSKILKNQNYFNLMDSIFSTKFVVIIESTNNINFLRKILLQDLVP